MKFGKSPGLTSMGVMFRLLNRWTLSMCRPATQCAKPARLCEGRTLTPRCNGFQRRVLRAVHATWTDMYVGFC